jgi:hypothetical protein
MPLPHRSTGAYRGRAREFRECPQSDEMEGATTRPPIIHGFIVTSTRPLLLAGARPSALLDEPGSTPVSGGFAAGLSVSGGGCAALRVKGSDRIRCLDRKSCHACNTDLAPLLFRFPQALSSLFVCLSPFAHLPSQTKPVWTCAHVTCDLPFPLRNR